MRRRAITGTALAVALVLAAACTKPRNGDEDASVSTAASDEVSTDSQPAASGSDGPVASDQGSSPPPDSTAAPTTTVATPPARPADRWVDPASAFGKPWPGSTTVGMLTFRGNPTRSYHGQGPVPRTTPAQLWRYPGGGGQLCGESSSEGVTKVWCGTGWTGQPNLWERPDGSTWLMFGAYDKAYHFLDANTGANVLPSLPTGDINKGSATLDPDGYPLYYAGSRDNQLRVVALDRAEPTTLWQLDADTISPSMWNDDWDGAALVLGDYLVEGGENSQFHVIRLNRGYDANGLVTVNPQLVFHTPGWDQQLLSDVGDRHMSIENSVAMSGDIAYFANSGGLVQGWDLGGYRDGSGRAPTRTFRYWTGDDVDASIVVDAEGFLYVSSEYERGTRRAQEVGQLVKLDPRNPDSPRVWSWTDPGGAGIWSTPAIHKGVVITTTDGGRVVGLDQASGAVLWEKRLVAPVWQSPVVVDDVLLQGDCGGILRAYDVADPRVDPLLLWQVEVGGCLEATPTVWKGRIYVGSRAGFVAAYG